MPNLSEFNDNLKEPISELVTTVSDLVLKHYPRTRTVVLQYNTEKTYVGKNDNGRFKTYQLENGDNIVLDEYMEEKYDLFIECKKEIDESNPNRKLRSFNIFFNIKSKEINICRNRIGSVSMVNSRLFKPFTCSK